MKKKVINLTVIMIMAVSLLAVAPLISDKASAAMSVIKVNSSTVIDSKYSFSPRWISGETYMEGFGGNSYPADLWYSSTNGKTYYSLSSSYYYPIRCENNNIKGKVGVWYRNVGEYNGRMLDMKITVMDWETKRPSEYISTTNNGSVYSAPTILFCKQAINIYQFGGLLKAPEYKIEFYDKTGSKVSVSGHFNVCDIDDTQYFESSNFDKCYLSGNTLLTVSGNRITGPTATTAETAPEGTAQMCFSNKDSINFKFSSTRQDKENFSTKRGTRTYYIMLIVGNGFVPFDTPAPIKSGSSSVDAGGKASYNVAFTVPQQPSGYLYSKFVLTDSLPSGLTYTDFDVKDDTGATVTDNFIGNINGQTFTLTPKNLSSSAFYKKSYTVTINAIVDTDFTGKQDADGKIILTNQASITAQNTSTPTPETKTSNAVNTEVLFKIDTKTDGHGTITASMSGISGGSNKTITYTPNPGYELDTVTVDGKKIEKVDSYTFSNISKNHDISATFKPTEDNKIILTKKVSKDDVNMSNGTPTAIFEVSGTDLNGNKHKYQKTVTLSDETLKDGYYMESVTFDNLVAGNYTAIEIDTSRYELGSIVAGENASVSDEVLNCDLVNGKVASGTFNNERTQIQYFSHNNMKYNSFL